MQIMNQTDEFLKILTQGSTHYHHCNTVIAKFILLFQLACAEGLN